MSHNIPYLKCLNMDKYVDICSSQNNKFNWDHSPHIRLPTCYPLNHVLMFLFTGYLQNHAPMLVRGTTETSIFLRLD